MFWGNPGILTFHLRLTILWSFLKSNYLYIYQIHQPLHEIIIFWRRELKKHTNHGDQLKAGSASSFKSSSWFMQTWVTLQALSERQHWECATPVLKVTSEPRIISLQNSSNGSGVSQSPLQARGPSIKKAQCLGQTWTNIELSNQSLPGWNSFTLSLAPWPYAIGGHIPKPANQNLPCQYNLMPPHSPFKLVWTPYQGDRFEQHFLSPCRLTQE